MKVENAVDPAAASRRWAFFGRPEDGPFVMVNLLKFKARAEYADGAGPDLRGARGLCPLRRQRCASWSRDWAAKVPLQGEVSGLLLGEVEELWDVVALAEYPSLAAFQQMAHVAGDARHRAPPQGRPGGAAQHPAPSRARGSRPSGCGRDSTRQRRATTLTGLA